MVQMGNNGVYMQIQTNNRIVISRLRVDELQYAGPIGAASCFIIHTSLRAEQQSGSNILALASAKHTVSTYMVLQHPQKIRKSEQETGLGMV